ncbi:MAG: YitT family protein [Termitinemataceae bacterium]|nr:MAG: YitT family protein [Termitinemataceae bacterium]
MLPKSPVNPVRRIIFVVCSALIVAFNINTFIHAGALIPGGFTGIALLTDQVSQKFFGFHVPYGPMFIAINAIPAIICFKYIGKWFTIYSCINIILNGFITEWMPPIFTNFLQIQDPLLNAIFGGLLNAVGISLCLSVNCTSGGTDFIAIFFAEKKGKDAWNYILAGNVVLLIIAGFLLSLDKALYSIIFQFTTTMALGALYRGYQQCTLLIITSNPDGVYAMIRDKTNHDATSFSGIGHFQKQERIMLYSVVAANEVQMLIREIKKIDCNAFINIIKTEELTGKFFRRPKD